MHFFTLIHPLSISSEEEGVILHHHGKGCYENDLTWAGVKGGGNQGQLPPMITSEEHKDTHTHHKRGETCELYCC